MYLLAQPKEGPSLGDFEFFFFEVYISKYLNVIGFDVIICIKLLR